MFLFQRVFYIAVFIFMFLFSLPVQGQPLIGLPQDFCYDSQNNLVDGGTDLDGDSICDCKDSCQVCILGIFENGACKLSRDKDENGEIDECEQYWKSDLTQGPKFMRGDSNGDQKLDLSDAILTLQSLFLGGNKLTCEDASDINDDGKIDLSDAVYTLNFLFQGGDPPVVWPQHFFDGVVDGKTCGGFPTRDECVQGEHRSLECTWNELVPFDDLEEGSCEPRFTKDEWKIGFSRLPYFCDIYPQEGIDSDGNVIQIRDALTCEQGSAPSSIPLPVQTEICDVERNDEDRDGEANEGCENMQPQLKAIASPLMFITLNQHDHGFKIFEASNERDIQELSVTLVSGVDETEYDLPLSFGEPATQGKDFFTLFPSIDELNERGVTDVSVSGYQSVWDGFYAWQKSLGNKFPPLELEKIFSSSMKHYIKVRVKDRAGLESFALVPFAYQVDAGDKDAPVYVFPTDGAPSPIEVSGCSCSDIQVHIAPVSCDGESCEKSFPPFPWLRNSYVDGGFYAGEFLPYRDGDSAMELLGIEDSLRKKKGWFDPREFGLGQLEGIFPLENGLIPRDSPYREFYQGWESGPRFQGFHYQVKASLQGSECQVQEYVQSSVLKGKEVEHLTCDVWHKSDWPFDQTTAVEHTYFPAQELKVREHAGFFGASYACLNGFSPLEKDSPFYGYTILDERPKGLYYESEVKKSTSGGVAWQNTLSSLRDKAQGTQLYRIFDAIYDNTGAVCGCSFELVSDKTGWRILKSPNCENYRQ